MKTIPAVRDLALAATLALSCLASSASAGVIVVNISGGGQFTNLQAAVDAASDGDCILVKPGQYASVFIFSKSLTIAADAGANVSVFGQVTVSSLTSSQSFLLHGVHVIGAGGPALRTMYNQGEVRIQHCTISGAHGDPYDPGALACTGPGHLAGWPGADLEANPGGTAFDDCTITGGDTFDAGWACCCGTGAAGGEGLKFTRSMVAVYDCTLRGGNGGDSGTTGGAGGRGCRLIPDTSFPYPAVPTALCISGSSSSGGSGADATDWAPCCGGNGGDAITVPAGGQCWVLDTLLYPGSGGHIYGDPHPAPSGAPIGGTGASFDFGVPSLKLSSPGVVREGSNVILTLSGAPGSSVYLMTSPGTPFIPLPAMRGVLLAGTRRPEIQQVGTMPPSGQIFVSLPISLLPAGVDAERRYFQSYIVDPAGAPQLGGFNVLTVLDSAY